MSQSLSKTACITGGVGAPGHGLTRGRSRLGVAIVATAAALGMTGGAVLLNHAAPAVAAEKKQGVFFPEVAKLKNGMLVVVVTNRRAPVVRHMVWYKVGAADEPPGQSGIAHFLEHLMFKRSKNLKAGEFDRIIQRNGGRQNAFTSQDYTGYYQTVAKSRLALVMKLEAERMVNLTMDKAEVAAERKVIMEERRSRTENRPSSLLWEAARAALYRNHPYGIPVIGWMHEMARLSQENALDFYRRYYRPNNAILIVAGDVSMKEVLPLAKKYYGVIAAGPIPPRMRPAEPPSRTARRLTLRDRRVARPSWGRMYQAPSYNRGARQHAYALEILSKVLGDSNTSRLYEKLVVTDKMATRISTWYDGNNFDLGEFGVNGNPRPGVSVEKLEAAIDAEIARVLKDGVTREEVGRAKRSLLDSAIFARDSMYTGAMVFGRALTTGRTVEDIESWPQKIKAVTVEQVNAAARYIFQARRSVTAILLPVRRAAKSPTGQAGGKKAGGQK